MELTKWWKVGMEEGCLKLWMMFPVILYTYIFRLSFNFRQLYEFQCRINIGLSRYTLKILNFTCKFKRLRHDDDYAWCWWVACSQFDIYYSQFKHTITVTVGWEQDRRNTNPFFCDLKFDERCLLWDFTNEFTVWLYRCHGWMIIIIGEQFFIESCQKSNHYTVVWVSVSNLHFPLNDIARSTK